jgi:hypothetical protein
MSDLNDEEFDQEFEKALRLVGPTVVEVQCPHPKLMADLKASPELAQICADLEKRVPTTFMYKSVELFLLHFVPMSLDPPFEELLSATERKRIAERIRKHANGLKDAMAEIQQKNGSPAYPFQSLLSKLSVYATANYYLEWKTYEHGDHESIVHRVRFGIYQLLTKDFDEIMKVLIDASEHFEELPTKLHRPAGVNARRLYFLRAMTNHFQRSLGAPCRKQTLALASIFFDCSDLDEAAISKLAPVDG